MSSIRTDFHDPAVRTPRPCHIQLHAWADAVSGVVLCLMLLFGPWAYGTTEPWSIWLMNAGGYLLGALLIAKHYAVRAGYRPPRWEGGLNRKRWLGVLAVLSILIPVYALVAALNARATYFASEMRFEYYDYIPWLPHSFDSRSTWLAFWTLTAFGCSFWALRDWLAGRSREEQGSGQSAAGRVRSAPLPARMRWVIWMLSINGAVLGIEAVVQRLAGSPRLLFLVLPEIHQTAEGQFGPFAYRSNAAQYFNLLWPVCIGFWWTLNHGGSGRDRRHHWLLVCAAIMAACPVISTSRGGALVAVAIVLLAGGWLLLTHYLFLPRRPAGAGAGHAVFRPVLLFTGVALCLGFLLGWKALHPRLEQMEEGFRGRVEIAEVAAGIARDYPVFGIGPGTYESVSEVYRPPTWSFWPAQVHNDWLQTRLTFGWVGSALLAGAFLVVLTRWFWRGGVYCGRRFVLLMWLALGGCMIHAVYDFPFQIHSIVFLFLAWCAILSLVSRRPSKG